MPRRLVLKERDVPGGVNIGLISRTARYCLDHGYDVILEGILHAPRYADMLTALARDHLGVSAFYYLDVSFAETLTPHHQAPGPRVHRRGHARLLRRTRSTHHPH